MITFFLGLPNKGLVVFYVDKDSGENTMEMTVKYDLPRLVAYVLEKLGSIGKRYIESTLHKDLVRFNERLHKDAMTQSLQEVESKRKTEVEMGLDELRR